MTRTEDDYLIGERIKVANEKEPGVVTRIDQERGLIYVLFKNKRYSFEYLYKFYFKYII